jgi:hypothetical protein
MSENKNGRTDDLRASLIRDGYLVDGFDRVAARANDQAMADEALSIRLLAGYDVDSGRTSFLKHNGPEERNARAALARLVRDRMGGFSGELLALAIDSRSPSIWPDMKPTRRIEFKSPGRGKNSTLMRDKLVVDFIRRLRFRSKEPHDQKFYIMSAVAEFERRGIKIGKSRVHAIWSAYEKMLEGASTK